MCKLNSILLLSLLLAQPVFADTSAEDPEHDRFYLGASWVETRFEESFRTFEEDTSNFKVFGGYQLNPRLAVEASYRELGGVSCCTFLDDYGYDFDSTGLSLAVVGRWSRSRVTLLASAGVLWWEQEGEQLSVIGPLPLSRSGSEWIGGFGLELDLGAGLALRAEWERAEIAGLEEGAPALGLELRF